MNVATDHSQLPSAERLVPASDGGSPLNRAAEGTEAVSKPSPLRPSRERLQYFAAFRYLFDNPEWPQALALGSICTFIPVFGQVALLGYYYEIVERLHRDAQAPCPTFNFRRFAVYATRGVWAYLLILAITSLVQVTLQLPLQYTVLGVVIAFQSDSTIGAIVAAIATIVWLSLLTIGLLLMAYVVQPLLLRGGLSQELRLMFRLRWVLEYSRRVWLEILLVQALLFMAMCLLFPLGLMLFCVGILPMSILMAVAGAHLNWQIYEVALSRGCEPVPLRPTEADEPPVARPAKVSTEKPVAETKLTQPTSPSSSASP